MNGTPALSLTRETRPFWPEIRQRMNSFTAADMITAAHLCNLLAELPQVTRHTITHPSVKHEVALARLIASIQQEAEKLNLKRNVQHTPGYRSREARIVSALFDTDDQ